VTCTPEKHWKSSQMQHSARCCAPPPGLCTDNGITATWNGTERVRAGLGVLHDVEDIRNEPKCPLGLDISRGVAEAAIKVPRLKWHFDL
jgi:tRNA A37 threonylcarbamoyltransferase TsaD